jgi:hypothetical protein
MLDSLVDEGYRMIDIVKKIITMSLSSVFHILQQSRHAATATARQG